MKLKCYAGHTSEVYEFYFEVFIAIQITLNKHSAALHRKCILSDHFLLTSHMPAVVSWTGVPVSCMWYTKEREMLWTR